MAMRRERVELYADLKALQADFVRLREAGRRFRRESELNSATWEPHDWGTFPCE